MKHKNVLITWGIASLFSAGLLSSCGNAAPSGAIAEWDSRARTVAEAAQEADLIVYARVIEAPVTRMLNFESPQMDANGTPDGTIHVTTMAFADTRFQVIKSYLGYPPTEILVTQTGGVLASGATTQFSDDPLYKVGEDYILFLVNISGDEIHAPDRDLYRTVSPVGRYRIEGNSATSPAEEYMNQQLPTTTDDLEKQIAEALLLLTPTPQ